MSGDRETRDLIVAGLVIFAVLVLFSFGGIGLHGYGMNGMCGMMGGIWCYWPSWAWVNQLLVITVLFLLIVFLVRKLQGEGK